VATDSRSAVDRLSDAMRAGPVILDGGLATLLEAHGHDLSSDLWSARLLLDDPGAIEAAHREYFAAGAQVAITASYQASFDNLARLGLSDREATAVLRRSVDLARAAAGGVEGRWVAASVGPFGAVLADGSEYRGDYGLSVGRLRAWHRPRLAVLAESGADLLALETIPCLAEVEALLSELPSTGARAWLSLTVSGGRTRAGEPVEAAFQMAAEVDEVLAVGVNCSAAVEVPDMVAAAAQVSGKPAVAYPNSGERWDADRRRWTGAVTFGPGDAAGWVRAGARLVGGCCRVGPDSISRLARAVNQWSATRRASSSPGSRGRGPVPRPRA
jgi:homocysteine S-methyltransferase